MNSEQPLARGEQGRTGPQVAGRVPQPWEALQRFTPARIATGRAGGSLPTPEGLRFGLDHALARDAVHCPLDVDALEKALTPLRLPIVRVETQAPQRGDYLQRPDLGRRLHAGSRAKLQQAALRLNAGPDLALILADGLSATAVQLHAPPLLAELLERTPPAVSLAPLVIARYARVALEDEIGEIFNARAALILIGERPGLSAPDSLGAYFVYRPRFGNTDAQRNCVSNIRPAGLAIPAAAETLHYLITEGLARKLSGTELKDERAPGNRFPPDPDREGAAAAAANFDDVSS